MSSSSFFAVHMLCLWCRKAARYFSNMPPQAGHISLSFFWRCLSLYTSQTNPQQLLWLAYNPLFLFSLSWSSARQTLMQPMNMETRRCIMPVSGGKTKWLRCVCACARAPPGGGFRCTSFYAISPILFCPSPKDLVINGAQVSICNKYGETPLDKGKPHLRELLRGIFSQRLLILTCSFDGSGP